MVVLTTSRSGVDGGSPEDIWDAHSYLADKSGACQWLLFSISEPFALQMGAPVFPGMPGSLFMLFMAEEREFSLAIVFSHGHTGSWLKQGT